MRHLKMNIEYKKRLTISSVSQNERSTKTYSPERAPKEPDKKSRHAQKRTQIMGPVTIDAWMLDNSCTRLRVRESR
jgi:hypothetical protein